MQQGGVIDKDLSVHYWKDMADLELMLKSIVISDLEKETGEKAEVGELYNIWGKAIKLTMITPTPATCKFFLLTVENFTEQII